MSECLDCKKTCFPTPDDCTYYTGPSNEELGIEQGASVKTVLTKVIDQISKNSECNKGCSTGTSTTSKTTNTDKDVDLETPLRCGEGTSAAQRTGKSSAPVNVKTIPTKTGFNIDYNLEDLVPKGATILESRVRIDGKEDGYTQRLSESSDCVGSFRLSPDNFDANMSIDLRYSTEFGEESYSGLIPLSACESDDNTYLTGGSTTRRTSNTQSDANSIFDNCIVDLQSQINSLTSNDIWGEFLKLRNRITELESQLEDVGNLKISYTDNCDDCDKGTVTRTLSEAFNKSATCCCETKSTVDKITRTVSQQQTQINNIPTVINNPINPTTPTNPGTPTNPTPPEVVLVEVCRSGACIQVSRSQMIEGDVELPNGCDTTNCGEGNPCQGVESRASFTWNFDVDSKTYTIEVSNTSGIGLSFSQSGTFEYGESITQIVTFDDGCSFSISNIAPDNPGCGSIICRYVNQVVNENCECVCPSIVCGNNETLDPETCVCVCDISSCPEGQIFDSENCECITDNTDPCEGVSCEGCFSCFQTTSGPECKILFNSKSFSSVAEASQECQNINGSGWGYNPSSCSCTQLIVQCGSFGSLSECSQNTDCGWCANQSICVSCQAGGQECPDGTGANCF